MSADTKISKIEETIKECYSTWGERYYADYYESETAYNSTFLQTADSVLIEGKNPGFVYKKFGNTSFEVLWIDEAGFQSSSLSLDRPIPSWSSRIDLSNSNKQSI